MDSHPSGFCLSVFYSRKKRYNDSASPEAQAIVKKIQHYITENQYTCTDEILACLGKMCFCGGNGTAVFVDNAIQIYCESRK